MPIKLAISHCFSQRDLICAAIAGLMLLGPMQPVRVAWAEEFVLQCAVPFADISMKHPIDATCAAEGKGSTEARLTQNRAKNNFCAQGDPVRMTKYTFVRLQKIADDAGISDSIPEDRTVLRDLHQTSAGEKIGEGSVVRFSAFILDAHYSNVSKGESVNCKEPGKESNDIHIALGESRGADLCNSVTAEISPHFRPPAWEPEHLDGIEHPVRITGQLFFDASHQPCRDGHRASPARISVWEIHPIYGIDVCSNSTLAGCRADDDSKWTPLHLWFGLEEPQAADEE